MKICSLNHRHVIIMIITKGIFVIRISFGLLKVIVMHECQPMKE